MNNLQAKSLNFFLNKNNFFISEEIEIDNNDIKKIEKGSFLEIENIFIKFFHIKNRKIVASIKLKAKGNYFFIDYKAYKREKKFNDNIHNFTLRFNTPFFREGYFAISKMPFNAYLFFQNKEFATINLYFNNKFYIEIKELF